MRRLVRLLNDRTGGTTVLTVLLAPLILAAAGLTIDTGMLLLSRQQLAAAVDAAALKAASTFKLVEKGRGEEVHTSCASMGPDGSCAEVVEWYTCWVLFAHRFDADAGREAGQQFAWANYPEDDVQLAFSVTEKATDSPVVAPATPDEKPPGRSRWAVQVTGSTTSPVFFLRIVGAASAGVTASSTVTWEKRDVYQVFDGRCASLDFEGE